MNPAYLSPLANHLWQSTLFASLAGLLALVFRRHRAGVRYGLWMAASVKFLVPFSLLISLGAQFEWRAAPAATHYRIPVTMGQIGQPFTSEVPPSARALPAASSAPGRGPAILFALWLAGFVWNVARWLRRWRTVRNTMRNAAPLPLGLPIPAMSTATYMEPGVFGILRPVLLLPEGIAGRLTPAQLDAIVAHELCHVRRRDNLAAAIHMAVESLFWFHPLVWWLESRLVEERERACDEAVLGASGDPEVYAESILTVCKFCLASPLACVSGVTGANLKQRIEEIMLHREKGKLALRGKLLLSAATLAVLAAPIFLGVLNVPLARAQEAAGRLAFEVASVKVNTSGEHGMGSRLLPGGHYTAKNVLLFWLIADAYRVPFQSSRLSGGPDWIRSEHYDIDARAEKGAFSADSTATERELKVSKMLQSLLADRFQLTIRRENKEVPIYALTVAKNGPKLQKSAVDEKNCLEEPTDKSIPCHIFNGGQGRGLHGDAVTMADLVLFVENWSDRPMVDKTGLTGLYNIQTDGWIPMQQRQGTEGGGGEEGLSDPLRPTLFMILDRLGLKLEPQRAPVERLTIERVERPTGN